ncbi:MAG TPA: phosphotransferase [Clostridia bacterium]|jgi:fructosamine-3-kinase|nr:phosphotransferase [Clostridia bacterium]
MEVIKDKEKLAKIVVDIVSNELNSNVKSVKYLGGGSFGRVFKVVTDGSPDVVVMKVCLVSGMHKKEAAQLYLLSKHSSIKIPKVYFTFDKTNEHPVDCLCMEFVEGKDAFTSFGLLFKSKRQKKRFANQVIDAMIGVHNHSNDKFGDIDNPAFDAWQDYYKPFATDIFDKASDLYANKKLPKYVYDAMTQAWKNYDNIFNEIVSTPALIHGDLNVMNIMVKKPFEIVAIIDPLNSMFADREYDLFQLNNLTGKCFGLYNTYKEKYPVSKNCDIKCAFYALWNEVYCYIKTGSLIPFIMRPIVKEIRKQMKILKVN